MSWTIVDAAGQSLDPIVITVNALTVVGDLLEDGGSWYCKVEREI